MEDICEIHEGNVCVLPMNNFGLTFLGHHLWHIYIQVSMIIYKVVQIWLGLFVCKQVTVCPGHIWTTLYICDLHNWNIMKWLLDTKHTEVVKIHLYELFPLREFFFTALVKNFFWKKHCICRKMRNGSWYLNKTDAQTSTGILRQS